MCKRKIKPTVYMKICISCSDIKNNNTPRIAIIIKNVSQRPAVITTDKA